MTSNDKISIFIKLNFYAAVACWKTTGIPVLFILGQKGLESDWGNSAPQFNSSGMTPGPEWTGRIQVLRTEEDLPDNNRQKHKFKTVHNITPYKTKDGKKRYIWDVDREFRAYDSAAEAWIDYGRFLTGIERYQPAFEFTDAKQFAKAIAAAGYATGVNYEKSLLACIDSVASRLSLLGFVVPHQ
ncbi:Flagellum-specific peptidoglycan hydrolase FlgJ [Chitinophaga jiangningensis]|uniref:Flagellum-specific peptidoglycan hydrolase FlgJ n=1 Tax=Chitinophaga jiangningensis TaxID=1419482 RepID=A0A1M6WF21_9BACT|nr:glucosaminidase domain-containing protein [Chitinophaga jiangningensis]SHK92372.1 Flagellum-specific peptidoglycan hydrolase FlgJ [Chitinophaga jiangningensis]